MAEKKTKITPAAKQQNHFRNQYRFNSVIWFTDSHWILRFHIRLHLLYNFFSLLLFSSSLKVFFSQDFVVRERFSCHDLFSFNFLFFYVCIFVKTKNGPNRFWNPLLFPLSILSFVWLFYSLILGLIAPC